MNAIYVRQSVDRPDSISIESQVEHCMYEVKKEAYKVYSDRGYSGKNTERPQFQLMLEHIKQGSITRVIVYKLDRVSRSILDFSKMMDVFQLFGVEFVSTTEKFDTSTPIGRAMLNICIVFAQLERETIQKRVLDAYIFRSRGGFYMGGRIPYGFERVPFTINNINTSRYIPIEEEVAHLQVIFETYSKPATSLSDVLKYLNEKGIKKKRGVEWSTQRISELLRNPIYVKADMDIYNYYASRNTEIVNPPDDFIGENACYLYTKNSNNMGKSKNMTQYDNLVLVIAPHKGIINSDTWIKCRLKGEQNIQIPNRRKSYKTWVSGKLKCRKCGYALRYNKWTGKTVENEYYLCSAVSGNHRCQGIGAVRKSIIEEEMLRQIEKKVNEMQLEQTRSSPHQAEINTINVTIFNKEKEIDSLLDKFVGGSETIMKRLNEKVDVIEREIHILKQEALRLEESRSSRHQINTKVIQEIFKRWDEVSMGEKQAISDILIKRVLVDEDKTLEIVWKV